MILTGVILSVQQFPVTGKIIEGENGYPLECPKVFQLHSKDLTLINGIVVNPKIEFELMAFSGTYIFRFDYPGYTTVFKDNPF